MESDAKGLTYPKLNAIIVKKAKKAHVKNSLWRSTENHEKEVDVMGPWSFAGMMLLMLLALFAGLRASAARRRTLRDAILQNKAELAAVAELVRQKKNYQAENLLIQRGNNRAAARTVVVLIRELLKSGEWDRA